MPQLTFIESRELPTTPKQLKLGNYRKGSVGQRLLSFLGRVAMQKNSESIWLIPEENRIVCLNKVDSNWSVMMKKRTFHQREVIQAVQELSSNGSLTFQQKGATQTWKVSLSRGEFGTEALLQRI